MSKPTELGFYWVRERGGGEWEPALMRPKGIGQQDWLLLIGDDCVHDATSFEFGPRIPQYEPDIHTRDTAVELPAITDADLEGA